MPDNQSIESADFALKNYEEAVSWINGLIPVGIKPGLSRMEYMMEKLGNPERRLKFIHVAGTNGKGSTCAYLTSVLRQCGYSVGMFTSPYLGKFTNRIQCDGQDIGEKDVLRIANEIKPIADELADSELGIPTMFEVVTALSILYFARSAYPDYVVWEAGLGGRFDSTNIVTPIISVITNIGHDHMEILGNSLEQVAFEKAGIIKAGIPVVTTAEQPEVLQIIRDQAKLKQSTLYVLEDQFHITPVSTKEKEQKFHFTGPFREMHNITVSMNGPHQLLNAAAAVMTLEVIRQYYATIVDEEDLKTGMLSTTWPGRMEMVSDQPRILLDGAHNPEGAKALADTLKEVFQFEKLNLMIGMLETKNHTSYLRHILPIVDTLIITEADFRKKMNAENLSQIAEELASSLGKKTLQIMIEPNWKNALKQLQEMTGERDLAVVTGTLYLISDVRSWILHQSNSEKGW